MYILIRGESYLRMWFVSQKYFQHAQIWLYYSQILIYHLKPKVSSDQKHMSNLEYAQKKQMSHIKNLYLFLCGLKIEAFRT